MVGGPGGVHTLLSLRYSCLVGLLLVRGGGGLLPGLLDRLDHRPLDAGAGLTPGYRSHGVGPQWLEALVAALFMLQNLVGQVQTLSAHNFGMLGQFTVVLRNHLIQFMGCMGDEHHCRWLESYSVSIGAQAAAIEEYSLARDLASDMFNELRAWVQYESELVVNNMARKLPAFHDTWDLGTDVASGIDLFKDVLDDATQARGFLETLMVEHRQRRALQEDAFEGINHLDVSFHDPAVEDDPAADL